jgi:hypothetical protein
MVGKADVINLSRFLTPAITVGGERLRRCDSTFL